MTEIATHRSRREPIQTVVVVRETPTHVSYRVADTCTLPRTLFDEYFVAIRGRLFIPREELEEIAGAIEDGAVLSMSDVASTIRRVLEKGAA